MQGMPTFVSHLGGDPGFRHRLSHLLQQRPRELAVRPVGEKHC